MAETYYVAPNGSNNNPGKITQPWATWDKAFSTATAGDTVYFRGGVYFATTAIRNRHSGTQQNPICFFAYPDDFKNGNHPILDGINKTTPSSGIAIFDSHDINLKGLTVRNNKQLMADERGSMGYYIYNSSNITLENCVAYGNGWSGFKLYRVRSAEIINCDSYDNCDSLTTGYNGGNADGFIIWDDSPNDTLSNVSLSGCRAWHNSDDGYDIQNEGFIEVDNCWAWNNGLLNGDGDGFKYGLSTYQTSSVRVKITRSIAAYNKFNGFDTNDHNRAGRALEIFNNLSYKNGFVGFWVLNTLSSNHYELLRRFSNNVSLDNAHANFLQASNAICDHSYNSWNNPPGLIVTSADFVSLDTIQLSYSRQSDGSLPDITFGKLINGSDLVDSGIEVGIKYYGKAPDLGWSESESVNSIPTHLFYVSSVIENAAPARLEMTYNLSLATINPPASAFTVRVNSTVRNVTTVAVAGTKVDLTLASPVVYGDNVTVAYTKPASNPLQTLYGGQASTISAQSVNNKVAAPTPTPTPTPAPVPVYVSSVIENAAPTKLEMIYSLSLAGRVPPASAFTVRVNSSARSVSSVAVSGTKVVLTLSSPVAYGNDVTVAYTKPSSNPLQTTSGGQAATISAKTVTNRVAIMNAPPVVVITSPQTSYSGFVSEISASGSYDTNKDNLTFSWTAQSTVPISSRSESTIEFLAPIVSEPTTVQFTVKVSDGKATQTKVIPVEILPYKPELEVAEVVNVEASSYFSPNYPHNVIDGNIGTMWAANGTGEYIIIELKEPFSVQHVKLAFQPGQKKESYFDVSGSNDMENWEPILIKSVSCDFSGDLQVFDFPHAKAEREYMYVKITGRGNLSDKWNYISELRIYGYRHRNPESYENLAVKVYPNPASEVINIRIDESSLSLDFIRIIHLSGRTVYINNRLGEGIREYNIPINLSSGIYLIQMGIQNLTLFTQNLIVQN